MFLNTYYPSPVLINLGPLSIHWYGLLITISVVVGFLIARKLFIRSKLPLNLLYDLIFYLILFSVIGARLWHVLDKLSYYSTHLLDIFKIWHGGLAIHGVILAGGLTIYFYSKIKKINFWQLLDIFAPLLVLGQAIGRWGNYFNQELYGAPTDLPWGIPINPINRLPGFEQFEFFRPIFLYESIYCLLLFGLLIYFHQLRKQSEITNHQSAITNHQSPIINQQSAINYSGFIFLTYLSLYSLERFLIGFLRIDPQWIWLNLRFDQWISLALIIISIILFIILRKKYKPKTE